MHRHHQIENFCLCVVCFSYIFFFSLSPIYLALLQQMYNGFCELCSSAASVLCDFIENHLDAAYVLVCDGGAHRICDNENLFGMR